METLWARAGDGDGATTGVAGAVGDGDVGSMTAPAPALLLLLLLLPPATLGVSGRGLRRTVAACKTKPMESERQTE